MQMLIKKLDYKNICSLLQKHMCQQIGTLKNLHVYKELVIFFIKITICCCANRVLLKKIKQVL